MRLILLLRMRVCWGSKYMVPLYFSAVVFVTVAHQSLLPPKLLGVIFLRPLKEKTVVRSRPR